VRVGRRVLNGWMDIECSKNAADFDAVGNVNVLGLAILRSLCLPDLPQN